MGALVGRIQLEHAAVHGARLVQLPAAEETLGQRQIGIHEARFVVGAHGVLDALLVEPHAARLDADHLFGDRTRAAQVARRLEAEHRVLELGQAEVALAFLEERLGELPPDVEVVRRAEHCRPQTINGGAGGRMVHRHRCFVQRRQGRQSGQWIRVGVDARMVERRVDRLVEIVGVGERVGQERRIKAERGTRRVRGLRLIGLRLIGLRRGGLGLVIRHIGRRVARVDERQIAAD